MSNKILRLPAVKALTGLSRSTIYLRISSGHFPKPVSLGGRAVGWIEAEVDDWLQQQIAASRQVARSEQRPTMSKREKWRARGHQATAEGSDRTRNHTGIASSVEAEVVTLARGKRLPDIPSGSDQPLGRQHDE